MLLAANKGAFFDIVIAPDAPPAVRYAAEELQRYIDLIALARPPVKTPEEPLRDRLVLIGESARSRELFPDVSAARLKREGYVLLGRGPHLLILGGSPRGTLYALYDFLERLGVRWWTPTEESVPSRLTLEIGPLDVRVEPPLIYRAIWYRNAMDADWQARMRLDAGAMGNIPLQERHGGGEHFAADATGHTYGALVPTETYFDEHPEYFCEVKGQRLRHMNQLCPTHPAVAEMAAETIRRWLSRPPEARIASVTQNDWGNWCTCSRCAAMIEREGTPAGPALHLANEVARLLEKDHPELLIDTFAYGYTQQPPRHMQAHPNVLVRLAPISNCFGHTIRKCPANAPCREAVKGWSKIARSLFVWHYVTDFFHYMTPFPNLPPLADDLRYYIEHGVKGVFLQGDGTSLGGDMCELKAYLMTRLMWDPNSDAEAVRADFLEGYYRAAAPAVEEYLAVFGGAFARAGKNAHLFLYRTLWENEAAYLTRPVLSRARRVLARGRRLAGDDPQVLERLDRIEAGLDYTQLFYYERPHRRVLDKNVLRCSASPRRRQLARRLFLVTERARVTHYGEDYGRYTTMTSLRRAWLDSIGRHEAFTLRAGGSELVIVPDLGGRIVDYRPAGVKLNLLGEGSAKTFGYPCTGGYEEYCRRSHQSPGFSEHFAVTAKSACEATLKADLETGLRLVRRIRLDGRTGAVTVRTRLENPYESALPGCLRAHLEIDLHALTDTVEWWFRRGNQWERREGKCAGSWYEDELPGGWAFWSEQRRVGLWQRWLRAELGALFLGTVLSEPRTLTLDLAHAREDRSIAPGQAQILTHSFGLLRTRPTPG